MLIVEQFVHTSLKSNTYLIRNPSISNKVWLIDAGTCKDWFSILGVHEVLEGVFITHAHYDHIYSIQEITQKFPNCKLFCSEFTIQAMKNSKLNLSFYREVPIEFEFNNTIALSEGDKISLYEGVNLEVIETPGHNIGSLSFIMDFYFFTGDSLVPGFPVVTKLKGGDKDVNIVSLKKINDLIDANTIICSGHGPMVSRYYL